MSDNEIKWKHCPGCGIKLPDLETLKFCTKCGLDLLYVRQYKTLPPLQAQPTFKPVQSYQPSYKPVQSYKPPVVYSEPYKPISDDEILDTKDRVLCGKFTSIGIPLLGFVVMNSILFTIIIIKKRKVTLFLIFLIILIY